MRFELMVVVISLGLTCSWADAQLPAPPAETLQAPGVEPLGLEARVSKAIADFERATAEAKQASEDAKQASADAEKARVMFESRSAAVMQEGNALRNRVDQVLRANVVPASEFLSVVADPNSKFRDQTNRNTSTNLGAGTRISDTPLIFRAAIEGSVIGWYDTGRVGSESFQFDPGTISLGGKNAHGAGQFDMAKFQGKLNFQIDSEIDDDSQAQAYVETFYIDNDIVVRNAYGRMKLPWINVVAGAVWTTWADEGTIPRSLFTSSFISGANLQETVPQLRFAIPTGDGWMTSIAVEKPTRGDVLLPTDDFEEVSRYPDITARVRYFDGEYFSVSVGGLFRMMGRQEVDQKEQFEPGWGVTGSTRFMLTDNAALMGGVVGGEGIAGSIFGLSGNSLAGGGAAADNLTALANYGAYAGYQHELADNLFTTLAYGFAQVSGSGDNQSKTQTVQNGWVNLLYRFNPNFAAGVQYDYGRREIGVPANPGDPQTGEDHRLMFLVSVAAGENNEEDAPTGAMGAARPEAANRAYMDRMGIASGQRVPAMAPSLSAPARGTPGGPSRFEAL